MLAMLNNISIAKKVGFIILLFVLSFSGFAYYSASSLGTMNDTYSIVVDRYMPVNNALGNINTATSDYRGAEAEHILSLTEQEMTALETKMAETKKYIEENHKLVDSLVKSVDGRKRLKDFEEMWASYLAKSTAMLSLSRKNQTDDAKAAFRASKAIFDETSNDLLDFIKIEMEHTEKANHDGDEMYIALNRNTLIASGLLILLGAGIFFYYQSQVSNPLAGSVGIMGRLAKGELDIDIPSSERHDEVGQIYTSLVVFKDSGLKARAAAEQEKADMAARLARTERLNKLTKDFEAEVGNIVSTVASAATQMEGTSSNMAALSEQTNRQAHAVADAGSKTSANVQTVATATEELSASISEIGRQVEQSSVITRAAVDMASTVSTEMKALLDSSQKIGGVVDLISEIANQTNLLALNATIEAARAGDAGKGFAVVASEVKNLASQTVKATTEITDQIATVQNAIKDSFSSVESINLKIGEISATTSTIAAAIQEQDAATRDISQNVQQAASGTQQVSVNIASVTEAASSTGQAATDVLGASRELSQQAEKLRRRVDQFIGDVKSA